MLGSVDGRHPRVDPDAWVAPNATVVGAVTIGARSSVFYTAVVRADAEAIVIGEASDIQDGCVLHADPGLPLTVGSNVSVGHRAVLHGCTVEDDVLVGMGAIVLNGAHVGAGSLVGAGALVPEEVQIPPGSLAIGFPAAVVRALTEEERAAVRRNAEVYGRLARHHATDRDGSGPALGQH